jgi:hypothetical protein
MKRNRHALACALALAVFLLVAILATMPVSALKVEGARISMDVEPGKTYTSPIAISIKSDEGESDFAIDVMGFGQSPEDGTYIALDPVQDTGSYTARTLITINPSTVHLKPGERAEVTATITIPPGTRDGGRYAIILVHPSASASGAPAAFATAVAIPVFLTLKSGTVTESGEISAFEPFSAEAGKSFRIITLFRNTGNYHYYGVVNNVTIIDSLGNSVAAATTEPFSRAIVPSQSVKFSNTFDSGLPQGAYRVTSRVEKQDGTLLDEKSEVLQIGQAPISATQTPVPTAPGYGILIVIGGIVAAFGLFIRRRF